MIKGIVAIAQNFAIGRGGTLPWHHAADLRFFKQTTLGNAVVMGSNTWRSIGRVLPGRLNIVLSRSGISGVPPQVMKLEDKDEVLELAKYLNRDIYVIGGAHVFESFKEDIDEWAVTEVPDQVPDADTFMPENFLAGFRLVSERDLGDGLHAKILRRMS